MNGLQITGTIRQRGQLTIPELIRANFPWVSDGCAVTILPRLPDEIIIKPYAPTKTALHWNKIWRAIESARSIKGKSTDSLSKFIVQDRHSH